MRFPSSEEDRCKITHKYEEILQFPHIIGAIDGKHSVLFNLVNSGSTCFSYKDFFSIALLPLFDADYKFTDVNIGCQGHISDGKVFKICELYKHVA